MLKGGTKATPSLFCLKFYTPFSGTYIAHSGDYFGVVPEQSNSVMQPVMMRKGYILLQLRLLNPIPISFKIANLNYH